MNIKIRRVRPNDTFENQLHVDIAEVIKINEITFKKPVGRKN